jgi:hypothetical protein
MPIDRDHAEQSDLWKAIEMARLELIGQPAHVRRRRAFGMLKGKLELPDSFFFDPLPDEELEVWEGRWGE